MQNRCPCGLPTTTFVTRIRRPVPRCCPCTNLLVNPGFDEGPGELPPPGWNSTANKVDSPTVAHSGSFVGGAPRFGVLVMRIGERACQSVPVTPGCCYRLTFEARAGEFAGTITGFAEASVQFSGAPANTAACLPPGVITPPAGDAILVAPSIFQTDAFQTYTLEVCVPEGARSACICFRNAFVSSVTGGRANLRIDNVVFAVSGGPCAPCGQLPPAPPVRNGDLG